MPTINPRITITLDADQYGVISRLSELQKRPMSKIVVDLLGEMTPMLARVVDTMELALRARDGVRESIREGVRTAEANILPHAEEIVRQYEEFDRDLRGLVETMEPAPAAGEAGGGKRSAPPASLPGDPRPVITGVRKPQRRTKAALHPGKKVAKGRA